MTTDMYTKSLLSATSIRGVDCSHADESVAARRFAGHSRLVIEGTSA